MAIKPYKLKAFKSKYPFKQESRANREIIFEGSTDDHSFRRDILGNTEGVIQPGDKFVIVYKK